MPKIIDEKSFWQDFAGIKAYPRLDSSIQVDTVIIGAGITGLSCAYMLKKAGLKVAVLEKSKVGGGTTGRTTGKVSSQHGITYADLQKRLGSETARIYAEANETAVPLVEKIIKIENIDCSWSRTDHYIFTCQESKVEGFKEEADIAERLGLPASFTTECPLPFEIKGAVRFKNQGKFNAQKYLNGLAQSVHADGSYIFEHSEAVSIKDGSTCRVKTASGQVHAKHIIIATSVPTFPLIARGAYCALEFPTESYLIAGEIKSDFPGTYISPDQDHYSIFPIKTGGKNMLLIGGEGGNLAGFRFKSKISRYDKLVDYARAHFDAERINYGWSDRDYTAYDDIPLIGRLYPWSKNLYVASAYRKWGLTNGTVAGIILRDLILSNPNPWAAVFDPIRVKPVLSMHRAVKKLISS